MKLISVYTQSHLVFKDNWFLPSLADDYDLEMHSCSVKGNGKYREDDWVQSVYFKSKTIVESIEKYWGDIFVYSDCDIQFFKPTEKFLLEAIVGRDIVCQRDEPGPFGQLCTGFFVIRANKRTHNLWLKVSSCILEERRDQHAFNRIIRKKRGRFLSLISNNCRFDYLPETFFSGGTLTGKQWNPGDELFVPENIVMHHANWTEGVNNKIAQLEYVKNIVESRKRSRNI